MRKAFDAFESKRDEEWKLKLQKEHSEKAMESIIEILAIPHVGNENKVELRSVSKNLNARF